MSSDSVKISNDSGVGVGVGRLPEVNVSSIWFARIASTILAIFFLNSHEPLSGDVQAVLPRY